MNFKKLFVLITLSLCTVKSLYAAELPSMTPKGKYCFDTGEGVIQLAAFSIDNDFFPVYGVLNSFPISGSAVITNRNTHRASLEITLTTSTFPTYPPHLLSDTYTLTLGQLDEPYWRGYYQSLLIETPDIPAPTLLPVEVDPDEPEYTMRVRGGEVAKINCE